MTKTYAIQIHQHGSAENLKWEEIDVPSVKSDQVLIQNSACGLNYIDVYHRNGLYPLTLPSGIGMEGVGKIMALGADVTHLQVGDRVAYCTNSLGAYRQLHVMDAKFLIKIPHWLDDEIVATSLLKGLTVQYLFRQIKELQRGDSILFYAAAGGLGLIACQWAKLLGVNFIGVVRSEEKAKLALQYGATAVINTKTESLIPQLKKITQGAMVKTVYDSIGKDTFTDSLNALAPCGLLVSYGNTSGAVPPFSLNELASRGSLFVTRPTLMSYLSLPGALEKMSAEYFAHLKNGAIKPVISARYELKNASQAHLDLEAGRLLGAAVLFP